MVLKRLFESVVGRPADTKASKAAALVAMQGAGRAVWTPRDYGALAREGYGKNPVVNRCVRLISEAAASVPLTLFAEGKELNTHPLLELLAMPNPTMSGATLLEEIYGHLLVAGNAYLERVSLDGRPRELHALRPDRVKIVPGADGWPEAYDYTVGGRTVRFRREAGGAMPILHLKIFHPLNDHYGFAPIEAAQMSLDIHNAASAWNKALLDNAARPSGALIYGGAERANLSDEQFDRLKSELGGGISGIAQRRPAAASGGRARLEADGIHAERHGFHRGEEPGGAGNSARLRRAADGARHSRRQHLRQFPGGEPGVLAAKRAAARCTRGGSDCRMDGARLWGKPEAYARSGRSGGAFNRARGAVAAGGAGEFPFAQRKARRRRLRHRGRRKRRGDALMDPVLNLIGEKGDLAHLMLFLWATSTTSLLVWTLKELSASNRRFNDFVQAIARLNRMFAALDDEV